MRAASGDGRFQPLASQPVRRVIVGRGHVPIQGFHGWKLIFKQLEVRQRPAARKTRENVVHAGQQLSLAKVRRQGRYVVVAALHLEMVALLDALHTHVKFRPAGGQAADFFAQEEIRMAA